VWVLFDGGVAKDVKAQSKNSALFPSRLSILLRHSAIIRVASLRSSFGVAGTAWAHRKRVHARPNERLGTWPLKDKVKSSSLD
jgi:hypothetical protein